MSHLNFNIRAVEAKATATSFNPRARVSVSASSVLWMVFAAMAIAGATFAIVWFA